MQYNAKTETLTEISDTYVPQQKLLTDDPQIRRTRETLLVLPIVCLTLSMIASIFLLILSQLAIESSDIQAILQVCQGLISIPLHGFGLFVIYRYSPLGLRVFAWLYAMMIILSSIGVLLVFLFTIPNPSFSQFTILHPDTNNYTILLLVVFMIIFVICFTSIFILSVMIVKLALMLALLIDANQSLINQEM